MIVAEDIGVLIYARVTSLSQASVMRHVSPVGSGPLGLRCQTISSPLLESHGWATWTCSVPHHGGPVFLALLDSGPSSPLFPEKRDIPPFLFSPCHYRCLLLSCSSSHPTKRGRGFSWASMSNYQFHCAIKQKPSSSGLQTVIHGWDNCLETSSWLSVKQNIPYHSRTHVSKLSPSVWTFTYPICRWGLCQCSRT